MSMREKAGMLQKDNIRIRKADEKDAFVLSQIDKECLSSECWSEKVFSENLKREISYYKYQQIKPIVGDKITFPSIISPGAKSFLAIRL